MDNESVLKTSGLTGTRIHIFEAVYPDHYEGVRPILSRCFFTSMEKAENFTKDYLRDTEIIEHIVY